MKISDVANGCFGNKFHGELSVAMQHKGCRSMIKAVLKDPTIEITPVGLRFTSGYDRIDVDFRGMTEKTPLADDDCILEYPKTNVVMSLAFLYSPAIAGF